MKKKLRNSSFRKAVINGVLIFGGVALLTTGFATWIIGATTTQVDGTTNVTVDTARTNNIVLEVKLTESAVSISEESSQGEFVTIDSGKATDFAVTANVTLTVGSGVPENERPTKITIGFNPGGEKGGVAYTDPNDATAANNVTVEEETKIRKAATYTYLDIATKEYVLPTQEGTADNNGFTKKTDDTGDVTYTATGLNITLFKWGSFFDNKSPSTFYNDLYDGDYSAIKVGNFAEKRIYNNTEDINLVKGEFDALREALNGDSDSGKNIHVLFSAVTGAVTDGE